MTVAHDGFPTPPHCIPKMLALLLCFLLVFSPWIFAPLAVSCWNTTAWAADITITGKETTRQETTDSVIITNGGDLTVSNSGSVAKGGAVYAGKDVTISNATTTLTNNNAGEGGGIYAGGAVTITGSNATFTDNSATSSLTTGSAIYSEKDTIIINSNVSFSSNNAASYGGNIRAGGAIIITNSTATFSNSNADACTGLHAGTNLIVKDSNISLSNNNAKNSYAGGIHVSSDMSFTNTNATFINNSASREGGAIYVQGSTVTSVTNSTIRFADNTANTGGGLHASGGVNMVGTTAIFEGNKAGNSGGGLFANGAVTFTRSDASFNNNSANTGGGFYANGAVTFTSSNATFNGNNATSGGGFNVGGGSVAIVDSNAVIINNKATTGGGFHTDGNLTLTNATITLANNTAQTGGGFNVGGGSMTITDTNATFSNNTAKVGGGFNVGKGTVLISGSGAVSFAGNTAAQGGGFNVGNGTVNIAGSGSVTFTGNSAEQGGGFWSSGTVSLAGSTSIIANNATLGGGIYAANSTVSIAGSATVSDNKATSGGGIYANGAVSIAGSGSAAVSNNTATNGGGIYANGVVKIFGDNAHFANNTATAGGGGIYASGTVNVTGSASFTGNTAAQGGGIYTASNSDVDITGSALFTGNTATEGGGLYASGDAKLTGSGSGMVTFANNAASSGGGVHSQGSVSISGSGALFSNNTAAAGGGIWAEDGVTLAPGTGNTITFATATDNIYLNKNTAQLTIGGAGVVSFRSANNHIPGGVIVSAGRTELRSAKVFTQTSVRMTDSTLYMGDGSFKGQLNTVSDLAVANKKYTLSGNNVGSGATSPYASELTEFHLGDNAVLALEMNHPGDAPVPYFTLNNGKASTGSNTTLHGILGSALTKGNTDFTHTYVIFTGSNGTINDFNPAHYTTSHLLISLGYPVYDAKTGTFAVSLVRGTPMLPNSPSSDPCKLPLNNLYQEIQDVLEHDYLYNGPDQQGSLVGQNPLLDTIFYVKPDGKALVACADRVKALVSAAHFGVFTGARQIMSETGTRLRAMLFSPTGVMETGGMSATFGFMPQSQVRWGDENRLAPLSTTATASALPPENRGALWVLPYYSNEHVHGAHLYDSLNAGYNLNLYGAAVGSDVTFGNGKYVLGGLFTAGKGNLKTSGDLFESVNDADFVGGMVSLRWHPTGNYELGAYAGLLHQRNDVEQDNILKLNTRFDSMLYQAGINSHYEFPIGRNGKRTFSVDLGADVQHFRQESLNIRAVGENVGHMAAADATTLLVPLTLGLREQFDFENGSTLTLNGRMGYRLAAGDRVLNGTWSIPGGVHSVSVHDIETDHHTGTAGLGLKWEKDHLSLTLDYDLELSRRLKNHMLMGQILWEY